MQSIAQKYSKNGIKCALNSLLIIVKNYEETPENKIGTEWLIITNLTQT